MTDSDGFGWSAKEQKQTKDTATRPWYVTLGSWVLSIFFLLFFLVGFYIAIWSVLMHSWYFILISVLIMIFAYLGWTGRRFVIKYMALLLVGIVLLLYFWHGIGIEHVQNRFDTISAKVIEEGPHSLSKTERVLLWQSNAFLGGISAIGGWPDVGYSTYLMAFRPQGQRKITSDMPMKNSEVRQSVNRWLAASSQRNQPHRFLSEEVSWDYAAPDGPYAGLAMREAVLYGMLERSGTGEMRLRCQLLVPIDYPEHTAYNLHLPWVTETLKINTNMFNALEARAWLHPYEAVFEWIIEIE